MSRVSFYRTSLFSPSLPLPAAPRPFGGITNPQQQIVLYPLATSLRSQKSSRPTRTHTAHSQSHGPVYLTHARPIPTLPRPKKTPELNALLLAPPPRPDNREPAVPPDPERDGQPATEGRLLPGRAGGEGARRRRSPQPVPSGHERQRGGSNTAEDAGERRGGAGRGDAMRCSLTHPPHIPARAIHLPRKHNRAVSCERVGKPLVSGGRGRYIVPKSASLCLP